MIGLDYCSGYSVTLYNASDCSGSIVVQAYGSISELFGSSNISVDDCSFGIKMSCSANDLSYVFDLPYIVQRYDMNDFNFTLFICYWLLFDIISVIYLMIINCYIVVVLLLFV